MTEEQELQRGAELIAAMSEDERKRFYHILAQICGFLKWINVFRYPLRKSDRFRAGRMVDELDELFEKSETQGKLF